MKVKYRKTHIYSSSNKCPKTFYRNLNSNSNRNQSYPLPHTSFKQATTLPQLTRRSWMKWRTKSGDSSRESLSKPTETHLKRTIKGLPKSVRTIPSKVARKLSIVKGSSRYKRLNKAMTPTVKYRSTVGLKTCSLIDNRGVKWPMIIHFPFFPYSILQKSFQLNLFLSCFKYNFLLTYRYKIFDGKHLYRGLRRKDWLWRLTKQHLSIWSQTTEHDSSH